MGKILIFSEDDSIGYGLLGKGMELAQSAGWEAGAVLLGADLDKRADAFFERGARWVYLPGKGREDLQVFDAGAYSDAIAQIAQKSLASLILVGCTRRGKELAARLAQKLGAGCVNDVTKLYWQDGQVVSERFALGGATVVRQTVISPVQVISVVPGALTPPPSQKSGEKGELLEIDVEVRPSPVQLVEVQKKSRETVDISEAEVLVCVGMGLGGKDKLPMIEELAKLLGGEVGCSKPVATDMKWLPEERLIGLSGKKCSPQLAICLGISGEIQFTVGIREAKVIAAVNTDPNAPIFKISDYGIIGDLHEVVPKLISLLNK